MKVVCTTKHAFTVLYESFKASLACIPISYDKPTPTPPRAVMFSLSGGLRSRLMVISINTFVYMVKIYL